MTKEPTDPAAGRRDDQLFRKEGIELSGPKEAFEKLKQAALDAIAEGDRLGIDVRHRRARLSDEKGTILFDGSFEEAARLAIDGRVILRSSD